jgi:hypothetical protein
VTIIDDVEPEVEGLVKGLKTIWTGVPESTSIVNPDVIVIFLAD